MKRRDFLGYAIVSPLLTACGAGTSDTTTPSNTPSAKASAVAAGSTSNAVFSSGGTHTISWNSDGSWLMDGSAFQFFGGEMHPARVPSQYWDHRIKMIKALGCNTISLYVMWNFHELSDGSFDFTSADKNIGHFIDLCGQNGMWVLLRPGPYVCAEWDFGGLPPRMLADPQFRDSSGNLQIRGNFTNYMAAVNKWNTALYNNVVKGRTLVAGGPIMLVAVENEYTSWSPDDGTYPNAIAQQWTALGYTEKLCVCDGYASGFKNYNITMPANAAYGMTAEGALSGNYTTAAGDYGVGAFGAECYPGWICNWGDTSQTVHVGDFVNQMTALINAKRSFVLYVAHGGTNFGFTAGGGEGLCYEACHPTITSYDYGAPVSESGSANPNFYPIQSTYVANASYNVPFVTAPPGIASITDGDIPTVTPDQLTFCTLLSGLTLNIQNTLPQTMESMALTMNQGKPASAGIYPSGVAVYQTTLPASGGSLNITFDRPPNYAVAYVNGKRIPNLVLSTVSGGSQNPITSFNISNAPPNATLQIVCMPLGRANHVASAMNSEGRGLSQNVYVNGVALTNWQMTLSPLSTNQINALTFTKATYIQDLPFFAQAQINITTPKDMYIDMSAWETGYVFVNGHNLGRYWTAAGPQKRLYCPGAWLTSGTNTIVVFEFTKGSSSNLSFYGESGVPLNITNPPSTAAVPPPVTNTTYFLQNVNNGLYLDVMPAVAGSAYTYPGLQPQNAAATQSWTVTTDAYGNLQIVNASTGAALDVANNSSAPGSAVILYAANGGANQSWKATGVSTGIYNLTGKQSQLLLDVNGSSKLPTSISSTGSVANILINPADNPNQQWPFSQQWRFLPAIINNGIYTITSALSNLLLGAYQAGVTAGTRLGIAAATGGAEQQWRLTLSNGYWQLTNIKSGLVMEVTGQLTANGTALEIWQSNGGTNQQFSLIPRSDGVSYGIQGAQSGRVIDDNNSGTSPTSYGATNVSAITIWDDNGGVNQSWKFTRVA
ncbi:beta-galactosidase [Collimonas humicola]|uniref:beta-galactosidase n=1 Tax=Collimonas humicola TaxID=2825886 RepID=UPI001B8D640A|nr:beta-galactosidase [Collimonas humicola]